MNDAGIVAFILLALAALAIDAIIPDKPGRWAGPASASDVAKIVSGGKPKSTPRHGAKLALLLVVVFVLWITLQGG